MRLRTFSASLTAALLIFCVSAVELQAADGVREVQQALVDKGYDPGPVDGIMGTRTRTAIREFQSDKGIPATGRLDEETQRALGVSLPDKVTVPAGTRIAVILNDSLNSEYANAGDRFSMRVASSAASGAIPRGAVIYGTVREVERAKRPQKGGKLVLGAQELRISGQSHRIYGMVTANEGQLKGKGSLKEDWKKIAIGAGVGAVIGGVAGGGKGVAAGLAIGGGGTFLATKGEQVKLPAESRLIVELSESVEVPAFQ